MVAKLAMEGSFKVIKESKEARSGKEYDIDQVKEGGNGRIKWEPPDVGAFKVNVDASFYLGAAAFSGMVLRDHTSKLIEGGNLTFSCFPSVLGVECIGIRETLLWVMNREERIVFVESDSLLIVSAINGKNENILEVGHIIGQCKVLLESWSKVSVTPVRKHVNKVTHGLARLPCSINCFNLFKSFLHIC